MKRPVPPQTISVTDGWADPVPPFLMKWLRFFNPRRAAPGND